MKKTKVLFWLILMALAACELVLSWRVKGFSDFYVKHIFPIFTSSYGRLFGWIKISVGELFIFFFVGYTIFTILLWLVRFVNFCDGKDTLKKFSLVNSSIFFKLLIFVSLLMVQNCFVLYHTTPIYSEMEYEFKREEMQHLLGGVDLGDVPARGCRLRGFHVQVRAADRPHVLVDRP